MSRLLKAQVDAHRKEELKNPEVPKEIVDQRDLIEVLQQEKRESLKFFNRWKLKTESLKNELEMAEKSVLFYKERFDESIGLLKIAEEKLQKMLGESTEDILKRYTGEDEDTLFEE